MQVLGNRAVLTQFSSLCTLRDMAGLRGVCAILYRLIPHATQVPVRVVVSGNEVHLYVGWFVHTTLPADIRVTWVPCSTVRLEGYYCLRDARPDRKPAITLNDKRVVNHSVELCSQSHYGNFGWTPYPVVRQINGTIINPCHRAITRTMRTVPMSYIQGTLLPTKDVVPTHDNTGFVIYTMAVIFTGTGDDTDVRSLRTWMQHNSHTFQGEIRGQLAEHKHVLDRPAPLLGEDELYFPRGLPGSRLILRLPAPDHVSGALEQLRTIVQDYFGVGLVYTASRTHNTNSTTGTMLDTWFAHIDQQPQWLSAAMARRMAERCTVNYWMYQLHTPADARMLLTALEDEHERLEQARWEDYEIQCQWDCDPDPCGDSPEYWYMHTNLWWTWNHMQPGPWKDEYAACIALLAAPDVDVYYALQCEYDELSAMSPM